jgi:hypothetical protein
MSTRASRTASRRRAAQRATPPAPTAVQLEAAIRAKFDELESLRAQIATTKALYTRHDALVGELLEMFIQKTPDQFIVRRSITVGNKTYRFTPSFYDDEKNQLKPKNWKSGAYPTGTIES